MSKIVAGDWRNGTEPMLVVSGPIGREKIHYEAPPAKDVAHDIEKFLEWFQSSKASLDGVVRAAVAHFWFVSIHPFQDGNGRIARAIVDMALAQDENSDCRLLPGP